MIDESSGNERLMRVRSRGRPRYLIQKRKVSADYGIGLIVVVKAQNGKLVLGGVKGMRIPRFLGQRVNGNAWDFALGKLHGVGTADLVHVHTGHGHANNIWELRPFHGLFVKVLLVATCLRKQLLERISALPVISLVLLQAALDDCARDRLVVDTLGDRVDASEGKPSDYRKKPETRPRNLIVHAQRIPPGTEARTCQGPDWCAIVNAFDILVVGGKSILKGGQ